MQLGFFEEKPKRKTVRTSDRKHLLEFQKGKCGKCRKSFKQMGVRAMLHHKNLNPKDNRISNMILVCPNCHDKIHQKDKKVRVTTTDELGFKTTKVVRKTTKKKPAKKKKTTKKKKPKSPFDLEIKPIKYKMPKYKPPKLKF